MTVKGQRAGVRWRAFAAVCAGYLAVTVGESVLPPLYPLVAADLGADLADAGLALGLLTGSIAVANVAGGYALALLGPRPPLLVALCLVVGGGVVSATAGGLPHFLAGQVCLGLAAGVFFAPGISSVGLIGGAARRGLVMGIFGVAFSGGLATAALLSAAGSQLGWERAFLAVSALGVVGLVAVAIADLPPRAAAPAASGRPLREVLGQPTVVGAAAAVSQYGTVSFFPLFAVETWGTSAGRAALLLAAARVLSVPMKTGSGYLSDRHGVLATIRGLGAALVVLGALWVVAPSTGWGALPAVLFAALVSGVFPLANVLALDAMGDRGALLGTYRSIQMGTGALAAAAIGAGAATLGLRPTLLLTLLAPAGLVAVAARGHRTSLTAAERSAGTAPTSAAG